MFHTKIILRWWRTALLLSGVAIVSGVSAEPEGGSGHERSAVADQLQNDDSLNQRFGAAELVAEVQIAGIHRDVDNALSEPGMVAILGYVYSAVSQQVWKGEANRLIAFRLGLDACDEKLEKGGRYLIFARTDSYGRLQLDSCEAFVPEVDAAPLLARIRQFGLQG